MTNHFLEAGEVTTARRVAAVCAAPEAARVEETLYGYAQESGRADLLWLTWVQWRAMGREVMVRETGLSLWTVSSRLRWLREAGVSIPSWTEERDLLARGQFYAFWKA